MEVFSETSILKVIPGGGGSNEDTVPWRVGLTDLVKSIENELRSRLCRSILQYQPVSGINVGITMPLKGVNSPCTWQKWSSQFFAPRA